MNNISTLKSTKTKCESPKTPGGISKSLLTPCRRVGLSRKWRNAGPSPFVSPLTCENSPRPEVVMEKKPSRKKARVINTEIEEGTSPKTSQSDLKTCDDNDVENVEFMNTSPVVAAADIVATPTRTRPVQIPRKSKSRSSISSSINSSEEKREEHVKPIRTAESLKKGLALGSGDTIELKTETVEINKDLTSKLGLLNNSVKHTSPVSNQMMGQNTKVNGQITIEPEPIDKATTTKPKKSNSASAPKLKSPNKLTKECVVVIQKKINKSLLKTKNNEALNDNNKTLEIGKKTLNPVSQALFDSDSDETPLSTINKKNSNESVQVEPKKRPRDVLDDDSEFHENTKVKEKLAEKETSTDLKIKINKKTLQIVKKPPPKKLATQAMVHVDEPSSQDSYDNDDDFDFDTKKTILIRKTYEKVTKPQKAKSTGSITQRDIEELKARIQMKKNQLLAKSMTQDTEELRNLIRKWKRGCQAALVELMDLMKTKCPEKCMQYSEILSMLKIPAGLVGYDSDNDCFVSPDVASIILSKFDP